MVEADQSGTLRQLVSARASARGLPTPLVDARFDVRVQLVYTITLGAAALVLALLLQWLFRKHRRPYGAHLIFALHYVAFMYLLTVAAGVSRTFGVSVDVAVAASLLLVTIVLKQRRELRSDPDDSRARVTVVAGASARCASMRAGCARTA